MIQGIEKSFTYLFDDQHWLRKLLIGSLFFLLCFVLIGIPFVNGYVVRIARNMLEKKTPVLPDWNQPGELFVDGFKSLIISALYALPFLVLGFGLSLPFIFFSAALDQDSAGFFFPFLPFNGMSALFSMILALLQPLIIYTVAKRYPMRYAFQFHAMFQVIKTHFVDFLLTMVIVWIAGTIAAMSILAFFIGVFIGFAYSVMVNGYAYGLLLRQLETKRALPYPLT